MAGIGLSKPYFAKYTEAAGVTSYSDGGLMGKAVSVDITINTAADNDVYADNAIAESERAFSDGTITLGTDDLSQAVSKALMGLKEQALAEVSGITDKNVMELIYDDDMEAPYLGVGMIFKKRVRGVTMWRAVVLTKVMFNVPADAATTQGKTITWQTPEITGTIMRDDSEKHTWKREATFTTETQAAAYIKHVLNITEAAA